MGSAGADEARAAVAVVAESLHGRGVLLRCSACCMAGTAALLAARFFQGQRVRALFDQAACPFPLRL